MKSPTSCSLGMSERCSSRWSIKVLNLKHIFLRSPSFRSTYFAIPFGKGLFNGFSFKRFARRDVDFYFAFLLALLLPSSQYLSAIANLFDGLSVELGIDLHVFTSFVFLCTLSSSRSSRCSSISFFNEASWTINNSPLCCCLFFRRFMVALRPTNFASISLTFIWISRNRELSNLTRGVRLARALHGSLCSAPFVRFV